jgi:hypothetical protein
LKKIHQSGPRELAQLQEVKALDQVWPLQFEARICTKSWSENLNLQL